MGLIDSYNKIKEYSRIKSREKRVEQEITNALIEDTQFSKEYSSFVKGLIDKLDQALIVDNYLEITIKPAMNKRSYFLNFMQDEQYKNYYVIEETAGKEFRFRLRTNTFDEFENNNRR